MKKFYPLLLAVGILFMQQCKSSSEADTGLVITKPTSPEAPAINSSLPGYIYVAQNQFTVNVGSSVKAATKLVNSQGEPVAQPTFSWVSSQPSVAQVAPDGTIKGLSEGSTLVEVTDGLHGTNQVLVTVVKASETISTKPVNTTFDRPIVLVPVGAAQKLNYSLTNASGQPVTGNADFFSSAASPDISIASGAVTVNKAGVFTIAARTLSDTLSGSVTIIAYNPPATSGSCDTSFKVTSVAMQNCPRKMLAGAASAPLRVTVIRMRSCYTSLNSIARITQEAPTQLKIGLAAVASAGTNGQIRAMKPGFTSIAAQVGSVSSDPLYLDVLVDVGGKWALSGKDGKVGVVEFPVKNPAVEYHTAQDAASGARTEARTYNLSGSSCLREPSGQAFCQGGASAMLLRAYPGKLFGQVGSGPEWRGPGELLETGNGVGSIDLCAGSSTLLFQSENVLTTSAYTLTKNSDASCAASELINCDHGCYNPSCQKSTSLTGGNSKRWKNVVDGEFKAADGSNIPVEQTLTFKIDGTVQFSRVKVYPKTGVREALSTDVYKWCIPSCENKIFLAAFDTNEKRCVLAELNIIFSQNSFTISSDGDGAGSEYRPY